jgi:hypothetical protein
MPFRLTSLQVRVCGAGVAGAAVDGATASRERVKLGRYIYAPVSPGQTSSSSAASASASASAAPAGGHSLRLLRPLLTRVARHYGERGGGHAQTGPVPFAPHDSGAGSGSRSAAAPASATLGPTAAVQLDCLRKLWDSLRAGNSCQWQQGRVVDSKDRVRVAWTSAVAMSCFTLAAPLAAYLDSD